MKTRFNLISFVLLFFALPVFAANIQTNFIAPDGGDQKTPYACSFHWFQLQDGRVVGLDLIRSDDTDKYALRAYYEDAAGSFVGMNAESAQSNWLPFVTESEKLGAAKESGRDFLARGKNWIAGKVTTQGSFPIEFNLKITPKTPGIGLGEIGLIFANLSVVDYTQVEVTGTITINGEVHSIRSSGKTSVHFGTKLPDAGFLATVGTQSPSLLMGSARSDNARFGNQLIGDKAVIYSWGAGGISPLSFNITKFTQPIDIGASQFVRIDEVLGAFDHVLLGVPTRTGLAKATLIKKNIWGETETIDLGKVVFDFRGDAYLRTLP
ncbi:MAG: hypothetical protein AB7T49_18970 [Oligoflexales bacterium]